MSGPSDQVLEYSKEHDGEETAVIKLLNGNPKKFDETGESMGKGLTDAFIVDLLNESSNDSDSDIEVIPISKSLVSSINSGDKNIENAPESIEQSEGTIKETVQKTVNDVSMNEIETCVVNVTSDILNKVETSSLNLNGNKNETGKVNNFNDHREAEEWTDDESASSTTSSSDSDTFFEELHRVSPVKINPVKTKGELDIEDLPPIEELNISVEKSELTKVGKIHAIVTKQVVVQAIKDQTPLDMDSVLFLSENEPLGRIFEVFGPVVEPFYVVLFNSAEDIKKKNITVGTEVFFAPKKRDITMYVFIDALRQQKGSDASWTDNNEPPEEFLDYSDDEQERAAKLKRRAKTRGREDDDEVDIISVKSVFKSEESVSDSSRSTPSNQRRLNFRNSAENNTQFNYAKHTPRNTATPESNRYISKQFSSRNTNTLDDVPVWISSPPPFLEVARISSSPVNNHNPSLLQTVNFQQTSNSLSYQPRLAHSSPANTNSPQYRTNQVQLRPPVFHNMQPYIPSQAANINAAPVFLQPSQRINNASPHQAPMVMQSQSPFMPTKNQTYFQAYAAMNMQQSHAVQSSHGPVQLQPSPMVYNYRQPYVFGQVTPMPVLPTVQSPVAPMHVYAAAPQPHMSGAHGQQWQQREDPRTPPLPMSGTSSQQWQQREGPRTPPLPMTGTTNHHWQQRDGLATPPVSSPLRVQIPSYNNIPPVVRFSASPSIPPPKPAYYSTSHQNHSYSNRY